MSLILKWKKIAENEKQLQNGHFSLGFINIYYTFFFSFNIKKTSGEISYAVYKKNRA